MMVWGTAHQLHTLIVTHWQIIPNIGFHCEIMVRKEDFVTMRQVDRGNGLNSGKQPRANLCLNSFIRATPANDVEKPSDNKQA